MGPGTHACFNHATLARVLDPNEPGMGELLRIDGQIGEAIEAGDVAGGGEGGIRARRCPLDAVAGGREHRGADDQDDVPAHYRLLWGIPEEAASSIRDW